MGIEHKDSMQRFELIRELHDRSGASMSQCHRVFVQCGDDVEKALKALKKQLSNPTRFT
jgi:translation elongation factor EF-Ts